MGKPLIYVAAPYSSSPVANTRAAIVAGMALWETGLAAVIVPHLTMLADLVEPRDLETWYQFDLDQLAHADALWRLTGASTGADLEVAFANDLGIPVFVDRLDVEEFCRSRISVPDILGPRPGLAATRSRHPSNRDR